MQRLHSDIVFKLTLRDTRALLKRKARSLLSRSFTTSPFRSINKIDQRGCQKKILITVNDVVSSETDLQSLSSHES